MLRSPAVCFCFFFLARKILPLGMFQNNMTIFMVTVKLAQDTAGLLAKRRVVENYMCPVWQQLYGRNIRE